MRRCACVIRIDPATMKTNDANRNSTLPMLKGLSARTVALKFVCSISSMIAFGMRATMPARMISEMPLPRPYSSICSPSHIKKIDPAVSEKTPVTQNMMSCCPRNAFCTSGGLVVCM